MRENKWVTLMARQGWRTTLIAALGCVGACVAAAAAEDTAQPNAPEVSAAGLAPTDVKTYGDWVVRCFPIKSPARCDMFQATLDKASQRRIVSVSIAYAPSTGIYGAKIIVPLEVRLDAGVVVTADKFTSAAMAYTRCEHDGCYMEDKLDPALVENLTKGQAASLVVASVPGARVTLPLSLRGFSDALSAMKSLAIEKNQNQ
jgi:invasion protein IalB